MRRMWSVFSFMFHLHWSSQTPPFCILMYFTCFVSFWLFIFFLKKKLCTMNWHDEPVPRGTLVPSLGMAHCVPHKHGRQKSSSNLARVDRAEWHERAACAEKVHPAIWHEGTVPPATGFFACDFLLFPSFSCFFLSSSLSTKAKTLTSPPC